MIELIFDNKKKEKNKVNKREEISATVHKYIIEEDSNNTKITIFGLPIVYKNMLNNISKDNLKVINLSKQKFHLSSDFNNIKAETIIWEGATIDCNNISSLFKDCCNLNEIVLTNATFYNLNDATEMFFGCKNLTKIIGLNTITINTEIYYATTMFCLCLKLEEINLTKFHFNKKCILDNLFYGCLKLKTIKFNETIRKEQVLRYYIEKFNNKKRLTTNTALLYGCDNIYEIYLNEKKYSKHQEGEYINFIESV